MNINHLNQKNARTEQKLKDVLKTLCRIAGKSTPFKLPKNKEEVIPYLKKEIQKTLEII